MRYAKVTNNIPTETSFKQIKNENPNVSFPKEPSEALMAEYDVYPIQDTPPTLAVNEEIVSTDLSFDGSTVTKNYTVAETMTMAEWDALQATQADEGMLLNKILKLAFIQTELIDQLLADGTISATDFTPAVRQEYLDIKAAVDRLKA